jgi:hypothetical protein
VSAASFLISAMPHFGQSPGLSLCTSGCMEQVYVSVFATAVSSVAVFSFGEFLQALKPRVNESAMVAITMNVFILLRILNDVESQVSSIHPGKLSLRNFF